MKKIFLLALLAITSQADVFAQDKDECAKFQQLVKSTYNFKPSRLNESQQSTKSAAMDRFWKTVKKNSEQMLPCLRAALQDTNADKWFRFDASNLLVEIDPSPASKAIQAQSYTAVDLDDVNLRIWISVLARHGFEGRDVSEAGSRWLSYPNAKYFLPEHGGHQVEQFQGALFIFGSMDESHATPELIKIVSQSDHPGRESALVILMNQATPESLKALKQVNISGFSETIQGGLRALLSKPNMIIPRSEPKNSREEFVQAFQKMLNGDSSQFEEMVSKVPDGERDVVAVLKPEDLPLVRKVRRNIIATGSPHAIGYYKNFSDILLTLVWKPELVK